MSNHTPGTWEIATLADFRNGCRKGYLVCQVGSFIVLSGEEVRPESNAKLIAAAPEMLESMKALVAIVNYAVNADILPFAEQSYQVKLNAQRIIAKAEGADHAA